LDFDCKKVAQKVLDLLVSREKTPCREELLKTFGDFFNCKRAKKQNQDMTNVFFKGQPEIFRNAEEYKNSDLKEKVQNPKNHNYNEQEIVLTAIHVFLLNASCADGVFEEIEGLGEAELKKVVSLRIQSDSKTKLSDTNPGLICLIRYKHEEDARKIIKIFGGTEDRSDTLNKPRQFLDATPLIRSKILKIQATPENEESKSKNTEETPEIANDSSETATPKPTENKPAVKLSELSPKPLITIIKKLKDIDWPKFGDNSESLNGKKVSKVGEGAWEKAIAFCEAEQYKIESKGQDLLEVKYANTQQEKTRKNTPEKFDGMMRDGMMNAMSPEHCFSNGRDYYGALSPGVGAYGAVNSFRTPVNIKSQYSGRGSYYSNEGYGRRHSTPEFNDMGKTRGKGRGDFGGKKYSSTKHPGRSQNDSWRRPTVKPSTSRTLNCENLSPPSFTARSYSIISDPKVKFSRSEPVPRGGKTKVNMTAWREQTEQKMKHKRSENK